MITDRRLRNLNPRKVICVAEYSHWFKKGETYTLYLTNAQLSYKCIGNLSCIFGKCEADADRVRCAASPFDLCWLCDDYKILGKFERRWFKELREIRKEKLNKIFKLTK